MFLQFLEQASNRWCRLYPDRCHVERFRHGTRWRDCWLSLVLSPQGTPSSSSTQTLVDYSTHQSRSAIKSSDNIIKKLIIFTVNTGAITGSASIAHLVLYLASPNTGVHFAFHFALAKLYTNSLYASLNTRAAFRGKGESNRSVQGMTSRGTVYAGRSIVDSPRVSIYGTSVSLLLFPVRYLRMCD